MMVYTVFKLILLSAGTVGAFLIIGRLICSTLTIRLVQSYKSVLTYFFIGFIALTTSFAVFITEGRTILLGFIPICIFLFFDARKFKAIQVEQPVSYSFLGKAYLEVIVVIILMLTTKMFLNDRLLYQSDNGDYVFYAKVSKFLVENGNENFLFDYLDKTSKVTPYHYADIWLNSLLYFFSKENVVVLEELASTSICLSGIWLGFMSLIEKHYRVTFISKAVGVLLLFASGIYLNYFSHQPFITNTDTFSKDAHNIKILPLTIAILFLCDFLSDNKKGRAISMLLAMPLLNISSAMGSLFIAGILSLFQFREGIPEVLRSWTKIIVIGLFLFFFYFTGKSTQATGAWSFDFHHWLTEDYLKTSLNIFCGTILQLTLLYAPFFLLIVTKFFSGEKVLDKIITIGLVYTSFVFPWLVLHENPNSVQLFYNFFVPFITTQMVIFSLPVLTQGRKFQKYLAVICLVLMPLWSLATDIINRKINPPIDESTKSRIETFFNSVTNPLGVFLKNEYTWAEKVPTVGTLDCKLQPIINRPNFNTISLSVFEVPIDTTGHHGLYEKRIIEASLFYRYVRKYESQTDLFKIPPGNITSYQIKFIREFKIGYLLTNYNYKLPESFKALTNEEISDKSLDLRIYSIKL